MAEEVARSEVHAAPTDSISGIILDRLDSYSARLFGSTGTVWPGSTGSTHPTKRNRC